MNVIGTAGHVDHGKSTLVRRLTGIDPDRFAEEKRRGLTIDLGFAWLQLPSGTEVGLIDVPGHERFIRNMLAGAGGISVCLFVVAANEGWKPQSAEHLSIIDLLGIGSGVVALTKSDTVDDTELQLVMAEVQEHLARSSLRDAPIVPCSAVTRGGLDELVATLDRVWSSTPPAPDVGRPRLWVDRVFTIAGAGTVVTGTLAGGSFALGDDVELAPRGQRARIRAIQSHKKQVERIGPGNRVALNLAGVERAAGERGDAVVKPKQWRMTDRIDVSLRVLDSELSGHDHEVTEKGAYLLYTGAAETPIRIKLLGRDRLHPGERGFAELSLRDPLPLARGDHFVVRDVGRVVTFGGGIVLDPLATRARRDDTALEQLLGQIESASADETLRLLVERERELDRDVALLRSGADVIPAGVPQLGNLVVSDERFGELRSSLVAAVAEHHRTHPLEKGMPREAARSAVQLDADAFDDLVSTVDDVTAEGPVLRSAAHAVHLSPEQAAVRDRVVGAIEQGAFMPPLAADLDAPAELLRALVDSGELEKIDGFYLTRGLATEAQTRVRKAIEESGPMTVAQIRDLLGTSRKYAVPLCEWLDRTGATRRQGDVRTLGPNA